ncbi:MAG TPA: sugar phosphate isomerase/epimerase family protein [Candidatus Acidoferrum sp.]|jgi:sugar phosphate isomerase/epimerase
MNSYTRRSFLESLSTLAAGSMIAGATPLSLFGASPQGKPHIDFPTAPRERIAVASYPFRAFITAPGNRARDAKLKGFPLMQFPAEVVEKFGVHGIEPLAQHFESTEPAYLEKFRTAVEKSKVRIVNIPTHVRESYYDTDASVRQKAIDVSKKWIDVAVVVGSPGVRPHINESKSSKPDVDRTAESLRHVADYAAQKNIVVTLENDDPETEDAFFVAKVIDAVNNPYLRSLPDFANSVLKGDLDFNYRAMKEMFARSYNISHVKDGEADDNGKVLNIDIKKTFEIAKAANYRGFYSMEYDAPGDPYAPTKKLIELTLQNIS